MLSWRFPDRLLRESNKLAQHRSRTFNYEPGRTNVVLSQSLLLQDNPILLLS